MKNMKNNLFNNSDFSNIHVIIKKAVAKAYSCQPANILLFMHTSMAFEACYNHILTNSEKMKNDTNIEGWIFQVSLNKCRDIQKAKKYTVYMEDHKIDLEEDKDTLLLKIEKEKKLETIENELKKLNPMSKKVLTLRFMNECNYDEISRQTGLSQNSIGQTIHRGKKKIQTQIFSNQQLAA